MFTECSLKAPQLCDWTRSCTPGIRRLVLLALVLGTHVCKLYSADHLGTFLKCFLQLGWRLTGVRWTLTEGSPKVLWTKMLSLNVPSMFRQCSLQVHDRALPLPGRDGSVNVPFVFPQCSVNAPRMFPNCSLNVPLVLFWSASCSWDRGSRASTQLNRMIPSCSPKTLNPKTLNH
jgi:hypothetical protein